MSLNRAEAVELPLGGEVNGVRLFWRCVVAEVSLLAAVGNLRKPLSVALDSTHAKKAAGVLGFWLSLVLQILGARRLPEIANRIVVSVAVNVVNVANGLRSMYVQPCKTMGVVVGPVDAHDAIALGNKASGNRANGGKPVAAAPRLVRKDAGFWVVVKEFAHTLRGKIRLSHDALLMLIGQRPARVDSTGGLRYFRAAGEVQIGTS